LKDLVRILLYFAAVIVAGALLAPPLYWGGRALAGAGVMRFLAETEFQKYFNRGMLVAAIALLWPTILWVRVRNWHELGLDPDPRWWRRLLGGFAIAGLVVAAMAAFYVSFDIYHWKKTPLPWEQLPPLLLSAFSVALLEEALFRGAIFGLLRRSLPRMVALFSVSFIFAAVHFLKPDEAAIVREVRWHSGFALLPHVFHQFAEPMTLLASFTTIFVLGWVLGAVTLQTRSLWPAIGFHAGLVFVKMSFSKFTKRDAAYLPWIGEELQVGLVPVAILALAGALLWLWLRREQRGRDPARIIR
jgi:membrane protease YdiL (CAAX protease family)